jgi:(E)-4-hydroxy-3-methylbut-2-enyl-diphosphate synthase
MVKVGKVCIGGGAPVVIQTMWKDKLPPCAIEGEAGDELVRRIEGLADMGCGLLRFACPDSEAAATLGELAARVSIPLCADIHFDYKIALRCLDFPIAKLRINPGNIGSKERVRAVVEKAAAKGVPIRIGVNAGSLPLPLREKVDAGRLRPSEALVEVALGEIAVFEEMHFADFVVSMKASGIADTINANLLFRQRSAAPLHIGVTEAGPLVAGCVRSAAALLPLLERDVGDTVRVSLSDTPENEVVAAREILFAAREAEVEKGGSGSRFCGFASGERGAALVSCPLCGRRSFDTHAFTARWLARFYKLKAPVTIAVMGCAVNGPGEARHADIGITGAGSKVLIFRHGKVVRSIEAEDADEVFDEELCALCKIGNRD